MSYQAAEDLRAAVSAPASEASQRRQSLLPPLLIIGIGTLIYINSFAGQFLFDDHQYIDAIAAHQQSPIWKVMFAPENITRPLVSLSLALNYAMSGKDVWSYHAFNLMIHLLAALALYGVVRQTLLSPRLRQRFGAAANGLALATALIWMVHPLQTQAVTYVIQRAESMMGLFYLVTLYCAIRSIESAKPARWLAAAIIACFAGMGCKAVIVTAPITILLYDIVFIPESVRLIIKRRWPLYTGLAATWTLLFLTLKADHQPEVSAGFNLTLVTPLEYLKSQFGVITYYVRLAVWPSPLALDYYWPIAKTLWAVAPYVVLIGALVSATIYGLWRRSPLGFLGTWFFIILLPTSSIMPIADLAVEHRMYLPLASIVALFILSSYSAGRRWVALDNLAARQQAGRFGIALVAIIITWFGSLTVRRNADYHSELLMWADVASKRPDNPRAHSNLGFYLAERGQYDDALAHFKEAIRINPAFVEAHLNAGMIMANQGRGDEALPQFYETLRLRPNARRAHYNIGQVLASQGHWDDAIMHYRQEIDIDPQFRGARLQLAMALEVQNRYTEALQQYRETLSVWPDWSEPRLRLAALLISDKAPTVRNPHEAVIIAEQAAAITSRQPVALDVLAAAYAADQRFADAIATAKEALTRATELKQDSLRTEILSRLQKYEQGRAAN